MNLGGIEIDTIPERKNESTCIYDGSYHFSLHSISSNSTFTSPDLSHFTLYILEVEQGSQWSADRIALEAGTCIQVSHQSFQFTMLRGSLSFLLAGSNTESSGEKFLTTLSHHKIKKVTKPWGHELWFHHESHPYGFKQICLNAGQRTSLQYHNEKHETMLLSQGLAKLHFYKTAIKQNEAINLSDVESALLAAPSSLRIRPGLLHRLEAQSDLSIFEVSTPHLNDVIRLHDDNSRSNGLIPSEHKELSLS